MRIKNPLFPSALLVGLLVLWSTAGAQSSNNSGAAPRLMAGGQQRQVIEEVIYPFQIRTYENPWMLPSLPTSSKKDPEFVLALYLQAMKSGNYDEALSLWDNQSQEKIREFDRQTGRTKADWVNEWRRRFSEKSFSIKERIIYGDRYTLIPYYEIAKGSAFEFRETLAFVKSGDEWRLTLDLAENPVKIKWMNPDERIRRLVNPNKEK